MSNTGTFRSLNIVCIEMRSTLFCRDQLVTRTWRRRSLFLFSYFTFFYTLQFQRSLNLNEDDVDHSVCPRSSCSAALFLSDICSRTHQQRNTGKWWSFIRHIFPRIMFFIWQHNLRKEPDSREKSLRNSASVGKLVAV